MTVTYQFIYCARRRGLKMNISRVHNRAYLLLGWCRLKQSIYMDVEWLLRGVFTGTVMHINFEYVQNSSVRLCGWICSFAFPTVKWEWTERTMIMASRWGQTMKINAISPATPTLNCVTIALVIATSDAPLHGKNILRPAVKSPINYGWIMQS